MVCESLRDSLTLYKDPIPEDLRKYLVKNGCITGSFVFDYFKKNESDIDIIIKHDAYFKENKFDLHYLISENYAVYLTGDYADESERFNTCYVKTESGTVLNLLFVYSLAEFKVWKRSTMLMKKILTIKLCKKLCEKKGTRILLFRAVKNLFREVPDYHLENDDIPF